MKIIRTNIRCLFAALLCISGTGRATTVTDSLLQALKKCKSDDTTKVKILNDLAYYSLSTNVRQGYDYAEKARRMAKTLNYEKGYYAALGQQANALKRQGKFPESIALFSKLITYYKKEKDRSRMASVYSDMSYAYAGMGWYEKALEHAFNALKIHTTLKDFRQQAITQYAIANHYFALNKFRESAAHIDQALLILEKHPDAIVSGYCYNFFAAMYNQQRAYDSAYIYLRKSVAVFKEQGITYPLISIYNNISETWIQLQNLDSATYYARQAIALAREMSAHEELGSSFKRYVGCLIEKIIRNKEPRQQNFVMGMAYLDSAQVYASGSSEFQMNLYEYRSRLYHLVGRDDSAYAYYVKFKALNDSIYNGERDKNLEELNVRYEVEKKEQENKSLAQQNKIQELELQQGRYLLAGISVVVLLVIAFSIVFIRQNRMRALHQNLVTEQKLLRSQMNPHFIFNSLAAIESFIYSNHSKEAGKYLSDFARLMRLILENSREEEISLEQEIKTLRYYLSMQQLRLEEKLQFILETQDIPDTEALMLPPMLTQPFIENAVEHGPGTSGNPVSIKIIFCKTRDSLLIEITDDGVGYKKSTAQKFMDIGHVSRAVEITRERLKIINRSGKRNASFTVEDISEKDPGRSGTRVLITLPLLPA